ncbi:MAG: AAA domain-containing protein [Ignavibacteria bacterium]
MEFIGSERSEFFFGKLEEILSETNLTPKERIPKFRSVMELLFKELTSDEDIVFTNLHSRESYYFSKYTAAPSELYKKIKLFRKFANRVVHTPDFIPTNTEELLALKILCQATAYFCQAEIPSQYRTLFDDKEPSFREVELKQITAFSVIVHKVLNFYDTRTNKRLFLLCENSDLGVLTLVIWHNKNSKLTDLTEIQNLIQPYTNLYVTAVRQDVSQKNLFHTTPKSIVVLEPDYLVDVTEIAECYFNSGIYPIIAIIKKFLKPTPSLPMIQGSIINHIFDEYLSNPHFDFDFAFDNAVNKNIIQLLFIFRGSDNLSRQQKVKNLKKYTFDHIEKLKNLKDFFSQRNKFIEPTFISKDFGIQGRLDVLLQSSDNKTHIDIVELKTGSSPSIPMWQNHLMQTVLYDILIKESFPDRKGNSFILYSRSEDRPLRTYPGEEWVHQQQSAIMTRNKIVSYILRIARGDFWNVLDENKQLLNQQLPPYLSEDIDRFYNSLNNLDTRKKAYLYGLVTFLVKELVQQKVGNNQSELSNDGFSALWKKTVVEKKDTFSILDNLTITSHGNNATLILQTEKKQQIPVSDFRNGDIAILYPQTNDGINPTKFLLTKCVIKEIGYNELKIELLNKNTQEDYFDSYSRWILEHDFRESNFTALFQSLYSFLEADKQKQDIILGITKPEVENLTIEVDTNLYPGQKKIVESALAAKNYFLIQGPPGTGKTSVILKELVKQLIKKNQNVLLLAYTNRAVDEICSTLKEIKALEYIRIGKGEDKSILLSELSQQLPIEELSRKLEQTKVFVSTQASLMSHLEIMHLKRFDTLIVDEASQLLDPHLSSLLVGVDRFILIGDEKQLPPVIVQSKQETQCNEKLLQDIGLFDYGESIFVRLLKNAISKGWTHCYGSLVEHFRMHKDIARFINQHYYNSILKNVLEKQQAPLQEFTSGDTLDRILRRNRLVLISVPAETYKNKVNTKEARVVSAVAKKLYQFLRHSENEGCNPIKDIGIITPFRAQISAIKNFILPEISHITIDTVERFQGSERRIIIISFAFKNSSQVKMVQSIYNDSMEVERKLNVALSRAQDYLVLVGDVKILEQDTHYRKLITHFADNGVIVNIRDIESCLN